MAKIRIYELAKQVGKPSKELVEELREKGLDIKSYMSTVDDETAKLIMDSYAPEKEAKPRAKAKPAPAAAKKAPPKAEKKPGVRAAKKAPPKAAEKAVKPEKKAPKKAKTEEAPGRSASQAAGRAAKTRKKVEEKTPAEIPAESPSAAVETGVAVEEPVEPTVHVEPSEPDAVQTAPPAAAAAVEEPPVEEAPLRTLTIAEVVTVKELAEKMGVKANDVIKTLMQMGIMSNINQVLDFETASLVAGKYGLQAAMFGAEAVIEGEEEVEEALEPRPPVVTVMGHVDHGKTRLLDAIRETNVMEKEAGGITQHIGAYLVEMDKGRIVFLDTPGHEAFTAMRARGAQVTDIVVLVVAADDGVMPQTREAVAHAKAAEVPIVVAINKIDKPNSRPERVKQQLTELGLMPEEWGGETIYCEVSAKEKTGIDELLEMILLQAEIMELKANPRRSAVGIIIEAKLDKGRGPVCTVLVQEGTLRTGDSFVCGLEYGKVRAMFSDSGQRIREATPSVPVEVLGAVDVPESGDIFQVVEEERKARQIGYLRRQQRRAETISGGTRITLDDLYQRIKEGEVKELNVVLKADVHGSLQAISDSLEKLSNDEIRVNIIHSSVGAIREVDIGLASASQAVVIGFNARPTPQASQMAVREGVDLRLYSVIYDLIADVKGAMEGLLEPMTREVILGQAEVREIFNIPRIGAVAGCYITEGTVRRDSKIRVIRDGIVVYESKVGSLRRFKEDVLEVTSGYECGISVEGYSDVKLGDVLESFELQEVSRKL